MDWFPVRLRFSGALACLSPYDHKVTRLLVFGVLAALCAPSFVLAQEEQGTAAARTLFHQGIACADARDFACAADRFRRSNELRPSPVVGFNLAAAETELGHLIVASELYRVVLRTAEGDLAAATHQALGALLPRLARVTVVVDSTALVMLDEFEMQSAMYGVAIPVDPGDHRLRALYGDTVAAEDTFTVGEGESITHTFNVPAPTATLSISGVPDGSDPNVLDGAQTRRRRVLGVTFGLVAAAAIAVLLTVLLAPSSPDPTPTDLPPVVFE